GDGVRIRLGGGGGRRGGREAQEDRLGGRHRRAWELQVDDGPGVVAQGPGPVRHRRAGIQARQAAAPRHRRHPHRQASPLLRAPSPARPAHPLQPLPLPPPLPFLPSLPGLPLPRGRRPLHRVPLDRADVHPPGVLRARGVRSAREGHKGGGCEQVPAGRVPDPGPGGGGDGRRALLEGGHHQPHARDLHPRRPAPPLQALRLGGGGGQRGVGGGQGRGGLGGAGDGGVRGAVERGGDV
ncbi:hypothetical protein DFJ74DRAFT_722308, partial [Hyaloraphidium curvatum]